METCATESNQSTECPEKETKTLKEDIKDLWKKFLLETSLHGCSPIPKSQYHWLRRLAWLLFVAASASSLIWNVVKFYDSYHKYPFKTKTQIERVKSLPLPAVSVCSEMFDKSKLNNSNTLNEYMMSSSKFVRAFGDFTVNVPLSPEDVNQITFLPLKENGIRKEDLILKVIINGMNVNVTSEFQSITTTLFGQCLIYNMVGEDGEGGNITLSYGQKLHMILNISQETYFPAVYGGMMLLFHDPNDLPTPSSVTVTAAPGFMTSIYLKATELKFLPEPYKSFGDEYCLESTELYSRTMKWHREYTPYRCLEECIVTQVVNLCNCTARVRSFRYADSLTDRICSEREIYGCLFPNLQKAFTSILTHKHTTVCDCPQPCETIQYDVRTSLMTFPSKSVADFLIKRGAVSSLQDLRDNYASVDISFDRMVLHHVEHVPEIDAGDIFGKLGGQMGLFLGASILTLLELAEIMLLTFILLAKAFLSFWLRLGAMK